MAYTAGPTVAAPFCENMGIAQNVLLLLMLLLLSRGINQLAGSMRNAVIYVMRRPGVHAGRIGITVSSRGQSAACDWPDSLALNAFLPGYESRGLQAPTL